MRIIFLLAMLFSASAFACINTYTAELEGRLYGYKSSREKMGSIIKKLESENAEKSTPKTVNDLAVAYIFSGNYEKAISLLQELETKYPGLPKTAANLGTALELLKKNEEALYWIRQGIIRDKNEHEGTEWLHVKILEAKIAVGKDPKWLTKNTVLGIDFRMEGGSGPQTPKSLPKDFSGRPLTLQLIEKALKYQLDERMKFVSPPDPYMADLLFSRGNIAYLLKDGKQTSEYYNASLLFSEEPKDVKNSR